MRPLELLSRSSLYSFAAVDWYRWLLDRLPFDGGRVLDLGAGTGALWRSAPRGRVVLCDISPSMCRELISVGPVARADGAVLPFRSGAFDGAIAAHSLYCLDDPDAGLRELRRVVRPGGWVAIATNNADHLRALDDVAGARLSPMHLPFLGESAPDRIAAAGFRNIEVHKFEDDFDVPDAEPIARYLASMTGGANLDDVEARAQEAIEANNGALTLRRSAVLVLAR